MIGRKFGKLTVLEECEERKRRSKVYKCLCDCGNITNVVGYRLRNGTIRSCGCLRKEVNATLKAKHGKRYTRLYNIWLNSKQRCYNTKSRDYKDYGERGIKICDDWLHDFMSFYDWAMSNGYQENLTIDRIDVNGNYEPSNCRWVDQKTQQNNKRTNVHLTYNGITKTMSEWASELNIKYELIQTRHYRKWSDKECLFGRDENVGL